MAEYICIAAGEKFQRGHANGRIILRHCSRVSAALQPRFCGIAAAFRKPCNEDCCIYLQM